MISGGKWGDEDYAANRSRNKVGQHWRNHVTLGLSKIELEQPLELRTALGRRGIVVMWPGDTLAKPRRNVCAAPGAAVTQ